MAFFLLFPSPVLIKACDICIFLHCCCALAFNHEMALFAFSLGCSCLILSPPQKPEEACGFTYLHQSVSMLRAMLGSHDPRPGFSLSNKAALTTGRESIPSAAEGLTVPMHQGIHIAILKHTVFTH